MPAAKLPKNTFPAGHGENDFKCFEPAATKDGAFEGTMIADLGCFTQDGKDTNKMYHGAVVQSKITQDWFAYVQWGRTGAKKVDFQFFVCNSKEQAIKEYCAQLHSKNDKRGEWAEVAGIKTLRAKKGKDCYLVRPQATRSTGLPDARSIKQIETITIRVSKKIDIEPQTESLLTDLDVATYSYARDSMATKALPLQPVIDDCRQLCIAAQKRIIEIGDDLETQKNDKKLIQITEILYGRIPKVKPIGASPETWRLNSNNILRWLDDLNAYEAALVASPSREKVVDPYNGQDFRLKWLDSTHPMNRYICKWLPNSTANLHPNMGTMKILNIWEISYPDHDLGKSQARVLESGVKIEYYPPFLAKNRPDLMPEENDLYQQTNTILGCHGTRSVNVSGILGKRLRFRSEVVGVKLNGAMMGGGLYFAVDWAKSAQYTSLSRAMWSKGAGGVRNRGAFIFLTDVVLGSPYIAKGPQGFTEPPKGHHSVCGKGGYTKSNMGGVLLADEYIIYKSDQNRLRYLVEFDVQYRR